MLFVGLFTGAGPLSAFLADILPPLQLMPALVRTVTNPHVLFTCGLLGILLLTLLFGRIYCSFLCPLGAMQDLIIAGSQRIGKKSKHVYSKPLNGLRYTVLTLCALSLIFGILLPVNLLDPYALSGRIFSEILQPLIVLMHNLGILALKPFNIYLYPKEAAFVPLAVMALTILLALLVAYLACRHGRLYCNTLCPVGALLGLVSRVSLFQFVLNQNACSACHRCESACKARCINPQDQTIDMSRCVGCFNCLAACSTDTVSYRKKTFQSGAQTWSPDRRGFVIGGLVATAGLLTVNNKVRAIAGGPAANSSGPVTPPGSVSPSRYTRTCTACALCVSICPTKVMTPTFLDFGLSGLMQPKMNYEKSFCEFECNLCGRVCPTGAILPLALDEKKMTQIGEARLSEEVCVVFVNRQNCGACGEVCPTHAIRFTDRDHVLYPEIDRQYCIGCGACQLACPTTPRSIIIHPHAMHGKAEKYVPPIIPVEEKIHPDEDFPF